MRSLADELGLAATADESPTEGFARLLASANRHEARNALARELWRLRWDRRKLAHVNSLKGTEAEEIVRNAQANLSHYLAQTPPVSSHHYYMNGEPVAELRCGCGDGQELCLLHAEVLARG